MDMKTEQQIVRRSHTTRTRSKTKQENITPQHANAK